jgi:hypothetical protein
MLERVMEFTAAAMPFARCAGGAAERRVVPRLLLLVAAAFLALIAGVDRHLEEPPSPALHLQVRNLASTPVPVLRRAERELSVVFRAAGVLTTWTVESSPPAAPRPPDGGAIEVILLDDWSAFFSLRGARLPRDQLAHVRWPEKRVYVFWPSVHEEAFCAARSTGEVLGLVIAHEAGHLLLGDRGHSDAGIMREAFDFSTRAPQRFSREQAAQIRAALAHAAAGGALNTQR